MRAVVFAAEGELTVAERPEPVPGPREVVIETAAVGICGTDTHVLDGEFEGTVFPLVPGHEATGTVVALGPGADEGPRRAGRGRPRGGEPQLDVRRVRSVPDRAAEPVPGLERHGRGAGGRRRPAAVHRAGGQCVQAPAGHRRVRGGADRAAGLRHPRLGRAAPADGRPCAGLRIRDDGPAHGPAGAPGRGGLGHDRRRQPGPSGHRGRGRHRAPVHERRATRTARSGMWSSTAPGASPRSRTACRGSWPAACSSTSAWHPPTPPHATRRSGYTVTRFPWSGRWPCSTRSGGR